MRHRIDTHPICLEFLQRLGGANGCNNRGRILRGWSLARLGSCTLRISCNSFKASSRISHFSRLRWRRTPCHPFLMASALRPSRTRDISPISCQVPSAASAIFCHRWLSRFRMHRHEAQSRSVERNSGIETVIWCPSASAGDQPSSRRTCRRRIASRFPTS
jgi:hypothetical protein